MDKTKISYSNYFPWYSSYNQLSKILKFSHSGTIPELFLENNKGLEYTELPVSQFSITMENNLSLVYEDDFTQHLTDSLNNAYFNKGNPFVTMIYDNTIFDMKFANDIYEILRFDKYLKIITLLPNLKIYNTYLDEGSDLLFKNFQAFDFDIKIKYSATSLIVNFLNFDLQMNPLTGFLHLPETAPPYKVSTFWNPFIEDTEYIDKADFYQPGFLGFDIEISPYTNISIGINPYTKEIQIRYKKFEKNEWFMYYSFSDTIFSDKNRLYTGAPITGVLQFSKYLSDIKNYAGTYWSSLKTNKRLYENQKLQMELIIDRKGSNSLLIGVNLSQPRIKFYIPKHLYDMSITGMGLTDGIINSKRLGNLRGYEIDSDIISFESLISPPELLPTTETFSYNDKKRLASRIIHHASNYNINYLDSILSLSGRLCIGARLLLIGNSLDIDLTEGHLNNVKVKITDTLKFILSNRLDQIIDRDFAGGITYCIASMEFLNFNIYPDHKQSIDMLLNSTFDNLENIFTGFDTNSSSGLKIQSSYASSFLARMINDPRHTAFMASALIRSISFKDYIILPSDSGQALEHFGGIAGPVIMTTFGLKLTPLLSLTPESSSARYCSILEQQIGSCIQEITPQFVSTEWVIRLGNNPAGFNLNIETIKTLLSDNNMIPNGPYSKVAATSHLGVACLRLITLHPEIDMDFFSASWKRILEIQLDSDLDISSSSYNTVSLLYWLTKNHKVDSLDYDCLQFFINPDSSCDSPPTSSEYIENVCYNISITENRRDAIQIRVNLNTLDNDMSTVEARLIGKDVSICFKIKGIQKILKGEGSLRQKAEMLKVSPSALIIYAAAFLTLYTLSSGKRNISPSSLCKYLTSQKFFDAYNIISCSFYSKYLGFVDNCGFNNYFI